MSRTLNRIHVIPAVVVLIIVSMLAVPAIVLVHPAPMHSAAETADLVLDASTNNTTSKPWWEQAWNDVTGAFGSFSYDASHWISSGLSGAYNSISGSISGFFGNIALSALEDSFNGVVATLLSFVGIATSEVSSLASGLIQFFVGMAISPALGPFGPILAIVMLVGMAVFTIILVRLLVDIV